MSDTQKYKSLFKEKTFLKAHCGGDFPSPEAIHKHLLML